MPLYLLDTNIPQNSPEDRDITAQLYGGDHDMRIQQEIILGIGGIRALAALGQAADRLPHERGPLGVLRLERIRVLMEEHELDFAEARRGGEGRHVLHHAHAGAGRQRRLPAAADRAVLLGEYCEVARPATRGVPRPGPAATRPTTSEPFCMTVLALRLAHVTNGVSKLHGEVSRKMWQEHLAGAAGGRGADQHVTNGVHTRRWLSPEMAQLYDRYLGVRSGRSEPADHDRLEARREDSRRRTVADARAPPRAAGRASPGSRLRAQLQARAGAPPPRSAPPRRCSTRRR